ncbi:MAG: NAD(P)H-binding protein [Rhodococcus sp.]|nr:NAD(P)H-binding protein [Rhodococcus sp. (in: high G+C Gram-positive bacteria)]
MSTALVVGGTGVAGREVAAELVKRGHHVRVLTRHGGTPYTDIEHVQGDISSGEGLTEALRGVDLLVDTCDAKSAKQRSIFAEGAKNLLEAAAAEGVSRAVVLSIINVDKSTFPYYAAKAKQEQLYNRSPIETVVMRATQFHDFIPMIVSPTAKIGMLPALKGVQFQTIDTRDVAYAIANTLEDGDGTDSSEEPTPVTIGGPAVASSKELVRTWKSATGSKAVVVPVPMPGALGKFFRQGLNLIPENTYGTITFEEWARESQR